MPHDQTDDVIFFLDRNMGTKIFPRELTLAGLRIELHDTHFPQDASDSEWLQVVGAKGWVVITCDRRIKYNKVEWASLLSNKVRAFVFTSGNLTAVEMASAFLKSRRKVLRILSKTPGPFIATISRAGVVAVWKTG